MIFKIKYTCWIPKERKIFAFCVCMKKKKKNNGARRRCHRDETREFRERKFFAIYEYSTDEQIFKKSVHINGEIPIELVQSEFETACYVMNQSKDLVLIVGVGSIIIFDFRQFKFLRCKHTLACPTMKHTCHCCCKNYSAVCTSNRKKDKLIVYGYIHDLYKNKEMQTIRFPSKYVIEMVFTKTWTEWIHLMRDMISSNVPKTHVRINIDQLINSCHDVINH